MKWATRPSIHIDRAASAWLIASKVDSNAEFLYVADLADVPDDATAFDMFGCDLGHHGTDVTFETILRRYEIADPILWRIAEIVHEADVEDGVFDAPEAPGLDTMVRALHVDHDDEQVRLLMNEVFDSLEKYFRNAVIGAS